MFRVDNAAVVPELNMTPPVMTDKRLKTLFSKVEELILSELGEGSRIVIGLDNAGLIAAREIRKTRKTVHFYSELS